MTPMKTRTAPLPLAPRAATLLACIATSVSIVGCDTWSTRLPVRPISTDRLYSSDTLELSPTTVATTQEVTTTQPETSTTQTVEPEAKPVEVRLSLADARSRALRYNLTLAASLLDPAIAREGLNEEIAAFDATFTTSVNYSTSDSPTATRLEGSQGNNLSVVPGVRVPLITGGEIQVQLPINRSETDNEFSELNPAYSSDLVASVSQPLLRGGGIDVNEAGIRIAFYQSQATELQTKAQAIRVIADVDRAYWRLQAARRDLEVRAEALREAQEQIARARRLVRAQQAPEVEVLRAESGAADQLEAVINAENALRQRQRELKLQVNDPNLPVDTDTIVVPESLATTLSFDVDARTMVDRAIKQRTELLVAELTLIQRGINTNVARNGLLPLLTLEYQYRVNGLGSSLDQSLELTREFDYEDHSIGLQVEIPIGNRAAQARYRSSLLNRMRALADRDTQAQLVRREVLDAVDTIRANYQRVIAARQRVSLNKRLLDAEIRQFENGQRTSTEVRDAQLNLANAESLAVAAEAEYQISQVDLAFATGTTLGAARISWSPTKAP